MSGEWKSYVSVEERELRNLRKQSQRADAMQAENRKLERQQRQEQKRNDYLERSIRQQENRFQEHENQLNSLGQDMQQLARDQQQGFDRQRKEYRKLIQETADKQRTYMDRNFQALQQGMDELAINLRSEMHGQRQEYLQLFKEQDQRMQTALKEQEAKLQQNIDNLAQSLEQRWEQQEEIAKQWLHGLQKELDFIRNTYRHEQFSPGEVAALESRLNAARQDVQNHMPQSAVPEAREAFRQALSLGHRLELIEMTWEELYEIAREGVQEALALADEYQVYPLRLDAAGGQEMDLDVDYWTEGGWQELRAGLEHIKNRLEKEKDSLQCEDLRRIIAEIDSQSAALPQLDAQARTALIASIKRQDIQTQICDTLAGLGYTLVDSTYAQEDFRRSYHLKMRNAEQEEIVTVVHPQEAEQGLVNELQFHFYDQSPNDAIREESLHQIQTSLQNEGVDMAPASCVPEHQGANASDEQRDFQRIRQQRQMARG